MKVNLRVIDINDNEPELSAEDVFVCENDMKNTVRGHVLTISLTACHHAA